LSRIRELPDESSVERQFLQGRGKPKKLRRSKRNDQLTVLNSLAMSIFRKTQGHLREWRSFAEDCIDQKLPWIALSLMNTLWFGCTKWFMNGFNLMAKTMQENNGHVITDFFTSRASGVELCMTDSPSKDYESPGTTGHERHASHHP
jgi:hypothetical protein